MADVFVSYSRSDRARVAPLVAELEAHGWSIWWDPAIAPGQEFDRMIAAQLARASAVLVVWTEDSVQSRWVRGEARDGADRGILVPVRFGNTALPIDFRAFHTVDLDDGAGAGRSLASQEAVRALGMLLQPAGDGGAPTPPSIPVPRPASSGVQRVGIAVLPFANLGGDPEQEFFSDGMTGDIITELSRWRMLSVRSRSATSRYRAGRVEPTRRSEEHTSELQSRP